MPNTGPVVSRAREGLARMDMRLGSLNGGLWCDMPRQDIPESGWTDGYDFIVNQGYEVAVRQGRKLINNLTEDEDLAADFPVVEQIHGMHHHRSCASNDSLLAIIGNQIARYNGSVWAWLYDSEDPPVIRSFAVEGRPVFSQMGDGTDEFSSVCIHGNQPLLVKTDGTNDWIDTSPGVTVTVEPRWSQTYIRRLWLAGDDATGTWIYCSDIADPAGWTAGSTADLCQAFNVGEDDGQRIVGLAVKFGYLFIFKERSIWYLDAYAADAPEDWAIKCFNPAVGGCEGCGYTIQDVGTDVIFASHNGDFRTLRDTDKTGLFATTTLSSRRLHTHLSTFEYDASASILDRDKGWYLLAAKTPSDMRNSGYMIYDYGKQTDSVEGGSPGLWYRIAPMMAWNEVGQVYDQLNARSCFCETNMFGADWEVLSGGYEGCIFREFGQIDEAKETAEAALEDVPIFAWLTGKHITLPEGENFDLLSLQMLVLFDANPYGSYVQLGAMLDPDERNQTVVNAVRYEDSYGVPLIWDEANWDEGFWDATTNVMAKSDIDANGHTFMPFIGAYGASLTIFKVSATLRPGRV